MPKMERSVLRTPPSFFSRFPFVHFFCAFVAIRFYGYPDLSLNINPPTGARYVCVPPHRLRRVILTLSPLAHFSIHSSNPPSTPIRVFPRLKQPKMTTMGIPYLLEDRTGDVLNTEFDELYDRMFFGVSSSPSSSAPSTARTVKLFELGSRSAPSPRGNFNFGRDPVIVLDFAPNALGTVLFVRQGISMPMASWMKTKGPARCFACSDGESYSWTHQANDEAEWAVSNCSFYEVVCTLLTICHSSVYHRERLHGCPVQFVHTRRTEVCELFGQHLHSVRVLRAYRYWYVSIVYGHPTSTRLLRFFSRCFASLSFFRKIGRANFSLVFRTSGFLDNRTIHASIQHQSVDLGVLALDDITEFLRFCGRRRRLSDRMLLWLTFERSV